MSGNWVDLRGEAWIRGAASPRTFQDASIAAARLGALGVVTCEVDLTGSTSTVDVILRLKTVLPLPSWCGANWDAVDDSFEDLRLGLIFPTALIVSGLPSMLVRELRLGLEVVVRLAELEHGFSDAGDQFVVLFREVVA